VRARAGALGLALALLAGPARAAELLDGVAAIVGKKVILRSELDVAADLVARRAAGPDGSLPAEEYQELRNQALRTLIDDQIMMEVAERTEMAASEEDIDSAVEGIARDEGIGPADIYAAARAQGLDRDTYRRQLAVQMTRMRVIQSSIRQRIAVTDEQVEALYAERYGKAKPGERLRVLHILVPVDPEAPPEQRAELEAVARRIREQALESGDFAGLARRYSAAPSAPEGGLTVFRQGDAPPLIEQALAGLAPGEISPLVSTDHGFNLFQFLDRFDPSKVPYDEVKDRLRAELIDRETLPEFEKWLDEVRKSRYVEIVNPAPR
jgi:peptidyl-prolyl cis-trans isomerase SurA